VQEKWYDTGKGEEEFDLRANQLERVGMSGGRDQNNSPRRSGNASSRTERSTT